MPSTYFSKSTLVKFYYSRKLSTYNIARRCSCDPKTVYYWLKRYSIPTRPKRKIQIDKQDLRKIYESGKSMKTIAKQLNCVPATICKRMKKLDIKARSSWEHNILHVRKDFSGTDEDKSYLIGFRLGDLNVVQHPLFILIKSNTTQSVQLKLMTTLFKHYGPIWVGQQKHRFLTYSFCTSLNSSFSFLLPKHRYIPPWILHNPQLTWSFIAGYTDAEGSFGIYSNRGRFRLGSYDYMILKQINAVLKRTGINCCFRLETPMQNNQKRILKGNFWRLSVNERESIRILLNFITPYLKHEYRLKCASDVYINVAFRL